MAEETGSPAPAGVETAVAASEPAATGGLEGQAASTGSGNAPGVGGDVEQGGVPNDALGATAAEFQILNRKFKDQREAERVLGAEIGQKRNVQKENAQLKSQLQKFEAELTGLRSLLQNQQGGAQGQGVPGKLETPQGKSFARELAENGELEVIAKIFADPEMGPAHAMYRMAELLDERQNKSLEQVREEMSSQFQQQQIRSHQERAIAKTFGVVRNLAQSFPELDESNESDEAAEAQQEIFNILKDSFTPEQIATNPERCIRMAVVEYRNAYGTPVFAQPPGTSGSPSVRAAQASEMQAATTASTPLEGSGVPRQRGNGPESPVERIKRENREFNKKIATTPSGRPLGFEAV
jgi:hypothetical protein